MQNTELDWWEGRNKEKEKARWRVWLLTLAERPYLGHCESTSNNNSNNNNNNLLQLFFSHIDKCKGTGLVRLISKILTKIYRTKRK
jgi:hypothetical protein